MTKNVPYCSMSFNPEVQIFSNPFDWDIQFKKISSMFELGPLCLIRTASEKMFLIRTNSRKYIEKKNFLVNETFSCFNFKISFSFRYRKCFLIRPGLISSGSTRPEFVHHICVALFIFELFFRTLSQLQNMLQSYNLWEIMFDPNDQHLKKLIFDPSLKKKTLFSNLHHPNFFLSLMIFNFSRTSS
jgi:hypothetical protein